MSAAPSDLTLDDVATLLLQLEPEDRHELALAREQLADLAFGNKVGIATQPLVARAVKALKPLADGTAADPVAAYAEVCALVERAMDAQAAITAAATAAPAPPRGRRDARDARPRRPPPRPPTRPTTGSPPTSTSTSSATSSSRAASVWPAARPPCSSSSAAPTTPRR
jgi:hypothetical protein